MEIFQLIKDRNARTVDWSNICDYLSKEDFLKMAKAVSSKKTVHYVHFKNWTQYYKGASLLDYKEKQPIIKEAFDSHKIRHEALVLNSDNYRKMWAEELKFLNYLDVTDWSLSTKCRDKYLDHFFGSEDVKFTRVAPKVKHWGFRRVHTAIYGRFTFV